MDCAESPIDEIPLVSIPADLPCLIWFANPPPFDDVPEPRRAVAQTNAQNEHPRVCSNRASRFEYISLAYKSARELLLAHQSVIAPAIGAGMDVREMLARMYLGEIAGREACTTIIRSTIEHCTARMLGAALGPPAALEKLAKDWNRRQFGPTARDASAAAFANACEFLLEHGSFQNQIRQLYSRISHTIATPDPAIAARVAASLELLGLAEPDAPAETFLRNERFEEFAAWIAARPDALGRARDADPAAPIAELGMTGRDLAARVARFAAGTSGEIYRAQPTAARSTAKMIRIARMARLIYTPDAANTELFRRIYSFNLATMGLQSYPTGNPDDLFAPIVDELAVEMDWSDVEITSPAGASANAIARSIIAKYPPIDLNAAVRQAVAHKSAPFVVELAGVAVARGAVEAPLVAALLRGRHFAVALSAAARFDKLFDLIAKAGCFRHLLALRDLYGADSTAISERIFDRAIIDNAGSIGVVDLVFAFAHRGANIRIETLKQMFDSFIATKQYESAAWLADCFRSYCDLVGTAREVDELFDRLADHGELLLIRWLVDRARAAGINTTTAMQKCASRFPDDIRF